MEKHSRIILKCGNGVPSISNNKVRAMVTVRDRENGVVKWFNNSKGYGFLQRDEGKGDVFVHYRAMRGEGYRSLDEGQRVEFAVTEGQKGLQAEDVVAVTD